MPLVSTGLPDLYGFGPGITTNFVVTYENGYLDVFGNLDPIQNTLSKNNAIALINILEREFDVTVGHEDPAKPGTTTGWFNIAPSSFGPTNRQKILLVNRGGGSNSGYGYPMSLDGLGGGSTLPAESVKMIFMNEWVEILMDLVPDRQWNRVDSTGEGLSQLCGIIRFPKGHYSYYRYTPMLDQWLNNPPGNPALTNYVHSNFLSAPKGTDADPESYGCALAFLGYLYAQRKFSMRQIIDAGGASLLDVYHNLTGALTGYCDFMNTINAYYPPYRKDNLIQHRYDFGTSKDYIFPVSNLATFTPPAPMYVGDVAYAVLKLDSHPKANIPVQLTSDDPSVVSVDKEVFYDTNDFTSLGNTRLAASITVKITATHKYLTFPQSISIHATYGGKELSAVIRLKSRIGSIPTPFPGSGSAIIPSNASSSTRYMMSSFYNETISRDNPSKAASSKIMTSENLVKDKEKKIYSRL